MKHKIISMITALMLFSAVMLVIGCGQANGNNTKASDSGNTASVKDLQGVWKVETAKTNEQAAQYMMHVCFNDSTVHAAVNVSGKFVKYSQTVAYNKDGTISVNGQTLTPVKNGNAIDLQHGGKTLLTMTRDSSVTADTITKAPAAPTPNPEPNQNSYLQGVWKLIMPPDTYMAHLYFDGSAFSLAKEFNPGKFAKPTLSVTYQDGAVVFYGQKLTPVKNGNAIDLQRDGETLLTMTKDASVTADTITKAPDLQDITIDELKGRVWKISKKEGGYVTHITVLPSYSVIAARETPAGSGTFVKYDKVSSPHNNSIKLDNDQWTLVKVEDGIYLTQGVEATIEKVTDTDGSILAKIKAAQQ